MRTHQGSTSDAEFWMIVHSWLHACDIKLNKNYIREELSTHPDYPSLLSVVDFLETGGLRYKAIHADASYIHSFNYPLLAHMRKPGDERMHMIANVEAWDEQKEITRHWSGIVVYTEKNARWKNQQNADHHRNEMKNRFVTLGFLATSLGLFILSLVQYYDPLRVIYGLLSLAGLTCSLFALGTELGFQHAFVKQVCGAVGSGGCEQVLKSRFAKGIAGITPADAAVLYFSAQYILYIVSSYQVFLISGLLYFSFSGMAVAVLSIYLQARLKQWCVLCLGIVAVLFLQGGLAFGLANAAPARLLPVLIFAVLVVVLSLILLPVKQLIKVNTSNKWKLAELKKWKLDPDLFVTQWKQEQQTDHTVWENDLVIGDPSAPLLITVACNPYCNPCSKAHKQLDQLLQRAGDKIRVVLRLTYNKDDNNDRRTVAARAILQKASSLHNTRELQQMLTDWFEWMDHDKWAAKWRPDNNIAVDLRMRRHDQWMEESRISHTPTFFINGKKLPGKYSLGDVEPLLSSLAETLNPVS